MTFRNGPNIRTELDAARADLLKLKGKRPDLGGPIQWLDKLLPDLICPGTRPIAGVVSEVARGKLSAGIPMLRGEPLRLDDRVCRKRWQRACESLEGESKTHLASAARNGTLDLRELITAVISGLRDGISQQATALNCEPDRLAMLLRCAIFADLVATNIALEDYLSAANWERGYCPTCGCRPLLGEFRGLEQLRYLRCGWCAASWKVPRLFCADCGNRDHEQLSFFHREGETDHRASQCHACGSYIKMITTLSRIPPAQLWITDIATLHLDLAAGERSCL
jgi:formate dehydrogenase accessory protein FdhE